VVYSLIPAALRDVPTEPRRDLGQLPRELRDVLPERVGSGGPVWVAGTADDWKKTWAAVFFTKLKPADRDRLNNVRTFAAWLQFERSATVRGVFDCRDEKDAVALQDYLRGLAKGDNADQLKTAVENGWLMVQWRTQTDALLRALEK
jgi:hypothetical protein